MAATTIGTINFGLTAETGLFAESVSFDFSIQERWIADADGDHTAGGLFGGMATWTIEGAYNTSGSPTWEMGGSITIANAPTMTAFFDGYTTGGRYVVLNPGTSKGNEAEERRTVGGKFFPWMTAS